MYQDNRREYGRVFGGVVFPGERPGFAVAVGEDRLPVVGNRHVYHQYLLGEFEAINHHDLLEGCIELSSHFNVDYFFWRLSQTHENLLQLWKPTAEANGETRNTDLSSRFQHGRRKHRTNYGYLEKPSESRQ